MAANMKKGMAGESLTARISKLNQAFQGKLGTLPHRALANKEGLLDALLVLYDECSSQYLMKNQYIASFVTKYEYTIKELRKLRINKTDFEVKNVIGRGHFGEVQVVHEKMTRDVHAMKVLRKTDTLAQQNVAFYEEERDIMARASSTWITQLHYAFQDEQHLYLVMDFHPGGDLLSLLGRYDDVFEETMARFYLSEMVLAVHSLHSMGYVHRDLKPENVLIDRTGHIKLADFGSACRMDDTHSTVSNMPVGTPDYICPEVLMKMNSSDTEGQFGEECDWWSLGVCAYEMLYGKTPFTDESGSMVVTYSNIMNFKKTLKFPEDSEVSRSAKDLMRGLLTDSAHRCNYEAIVQHSFFGETNFNSIRQTRPPFIPTVVSSDDTSNFDEFERSKPAPDLDSFKNKTSGFSGKDLPFVGFTFTRMMSDNDRPSVTQDVSTPACKASLERRLTDKSHELQDLREKYKSLEHQESMLKLEAGTQKRRLDDQNANVRKLEQERDALERSMAQYVTEISYLKRSLEQERLERQNLDARAMELLEEIRERAAQAEKMRNQAELDEVEECKLIIEELEEERSSLHRKIEGLEKQLKRQQLECQQSKEKAAQLQDNLAKYRDRHQESAMESSVAFDRCQQDFALREVELEEQLNRALAQNKEATDLLREVRENKNDLEEELHQLHCHEDQNTTLLQRLDDEEDRRASLESQVQRLHLLERREKELHCSLQEKSTNVKLLAQTVADVEETLQNREREYKKCERLYAQREDQLTSRVQDLEEQLAGLREERLGIEEQSLMVFEENEDRLSTIQHQESDRRASLESQVQRLHLLERREKELHCSLQEKSTNVKLLAQTVATISLLKGNVAMLEEHVSTLRASAETRSPTRHTPRRSARRSDYCQTDTPCSPKRASGSERVADSTTSPLRRHVRTGSAQCQTDSLNDSVFARDSPRRHRSRETAVGKSSQRSPAATPRVDRTRELRDMACSPMTFVDCPPNKRRSKDESSRADAREKSVSPKRSRRSASPEKRSDVVRKGSPRRRSPQVTAEMVNIYPEEEDEVDDDEDEGSRNFLSVAKMGDDAAQAKFSVTVKVMHCRSRSTSRSRSPFPPSDDKCMESSNQDTGEEKKDDRREKDEPEGEGEDFASKEEKRVLLERLSDLQQEKMYLELRLDTMLKEAQQAKDTAYEQRIRALDLKHDLREKTDKLEQQVVELKERLDAAELSSTEATETAASLRDKEAAVRAKLERLQHELDTAKLDAVRKTSALTEANEELEGRVDRLNRRCKGSEEREKEACERADRLDKEAREAKRKVAELTPRCKELDDSLRHALEEKNRFKMNADRSKDELAQSRRQCDVLESTVARLKALCKELEEQIQDFELLHQVHEDKQTHWDKDRNTYAKAVDERENEIEESSQQLNTEKQARQRADDQREKLSQALQSTQAAYKADSDRLQKQISEQKIQIETLNDQLTQREHSSSLLEVDNKSLRRRLDASDEEGIRLKEEISQMITKLQDLRASNLKLSKTIEAAVDRYDLLAAQKTDMETQMEDLLALHGHERYKMESTIGQQTKLIEYLQAKVENPPKKKKGLFGTAKREVAVASIHLRELQHSLDHEREKNSSLRLQITKLKDELHQARTETLRLKSQSLPNVHGASRAAAAASGANAALSMLALSPSMQASPGSTAYRSAAEHLTAPPKSPAVTTRRPKQERMRHDIPHRFLDGLNSRATTCAVCLGSIHFVKQAAKCQECGIVCHPRCVSDLPPTCGLPTEYVRHFTDTMSRARAGGVSPSHVSVANLHLQMEGTLKLPKVGKQVWEKRWLTLRDNKLYVYKNAGSTHLGTVDEFDLCPTNGEVIVNSAVTAAELTNTASCDLPYILRLEFEPNTTCWPGRCLYLMALSFQEKQKWAATLEAIVNHSGKEDRMRDAKVQGHTILSMAAGRGLHSINCSLVLSQDMILLGTEGSLYSMELRHTPETRPLHKLSGVECIQSLALIPEIGKLIIIQGMERDMAVVDTRDLQPGPAGSSLHPQTVPGAANVTTFTHKSLQDGVYLCVATAEKILIMKYSRSRDVFCLKKELSTSDACSCMHFNKNHIIVGTNKFYKIDVHAFTISEFLDQNDTSLAYAVFGTAHYDSFPIAVLQVAPPDQPEEFLLCFHEFGVFVDEFGRRSREKDMKWSGLPLAFAYEAPYLYMVHFSALQAVEILPRHFEAVHGKRHFVNLANPRYLGPAPTPSAVYIGTSHDHKVEVMCFKSNMRAAEDVDDELKENLHRNVSTRNKSPTKRKLPHSKSAQGDFTSPDYNPISPPAIRTMSVSPGARRSRKNSEEQEEAAAAVHVHTSGTAPVQRINIQLRTQRNNVPPSDGRQDSDNSF